MIKPGMREFDFDLTSDSVYPTKKINPIPAQLPHNWGM
jgi:hypothetical protein